MDKLGEIEIRINGESGNKKLTPDNFDIKYIKKTLENVEDLLYPNNKKARPLIAYDLQNGSVKHLFKTSIQAVIGFSAILSQIKANDSIDFLELKTARALENIQELSREKNYEFHISTSLKNEDELSISPQTNFIRKENIWAEAEFYLYGILKDAGGKNKANIHIDTVDYGYLSIETDAQFLKEREENLLYKKIGIKAKGKTKY